MHSKLLRLVRGNALSSLVVDLNDGPLYAELPIYLARVVRVRVLPATFSKGKYAERQQISKAQSRYEGKNNDCRCRFGFGTCR